MFVIYGHYRPDEDRPFYVGKGMVGRAFTKRSRSVWWKRIVKKNFPDTGFPVVKMLSENIEDESLAFRLEKFWIALFGRADLGEGCLINHTNGGEGKSGAIYSEQTKNKISISHMGEKNPMFGTIYSVEQRIAQSKRRGAREVELIHTSGERAVVQNRMEFARQRGIDARNLGPMINGNNKSAYGWKLYNSTNKEHQLNESVI